MGNIVLTTLSIFLGIFFAFIGALKVTQLINQEVHRDLRKHFVQLAKVFPLVSEFGIKLSPKLLRLTVGWTEMIGGIILLIIPGRAKLYANAVLISLMVTLIGLHWLNQDKFEGLFDKLGISLNFVIFFLVIAPCLVFGLMLICRLIVHYQVKRREANIEALKARVTAAQENNESLDLSTFTYAELDYLRQSFGNDSTPTSKEKQL